MGSTAEQFDFLGEALASGDFNDDGFTDLAVGAPGEAVGAVEQAGAVNVLFGSTGGLTGAGSQLFTQDTPGVGSSAEQFDTFGRGLAGGDFDADDADVLAVGAPGEAVGAVPGAGAINVLYGSTSRLSGTGSQLFTQNTPGVGSTAEEFDAFGEALAVGDFNNSGTEDLAVGVPFEAVGAVQGAGAVNVLHGRPVTGLTGSSSQIFTQDTPGVGSTAEEFDISGWRSPAAISTPTMPTTLRSVPPARPWARFREPARSTSSTGQWAGSAGRGASCSPKTPRAWAAPPSGSTHSAKRSTRLDPTSSVVMKYRRN